MTFYFITVSRNVYEIEVRSSAGGESVVTVELELSINNGVGTRVGVVRPSISRSVSIRLHNPDEFLARVVESELALDGRVAERFSSRVLDLLNEVFRSRT